MDVAVGLDNQVWEQFSAIEADGIKQRLSLSECRGLDPPRIALNNMIYYRPKEQGFHHPNLTPALFHEDLSRTSRPGKKGLPMFPCKPVGLVEYSVFARTIDKRIKTGSVSCPPESLPGMKYCA